MPNSRNKFKRQNLLQKHNIQIFSKENKTEQQASCSTARICLHTQNNFLCLPESYQEMLGYNPCCFSLFILTKRATKKDSISIYDKNIPIADLTANAPSHFLTLMLNSSELLTVIIWEELEDSSKKCWSAAFPTAGTARKQREMIIYTLQYHCIVCYVQTMITFDRYHKRFCSTIGLCA